MFLTCLYLVGLVKWSGKGGRRCGKPQNEKITGKAPTSHSSTASTYGLGTTSNYGHVKTIDNLTQSSNANGLALSAHQGYVLNRRIIRAQISGVTSQYGLVTVNVNNDFTQMPFVLTNIHDSSSTPYILDVQAYTSTQITVRVRSFIDGAAVINTNVNFAALFIGI